MRAAWVRAVARATLPGPVRRAARAYAHRIRREIPLGGIHLGDLGRLEPVSRDFGFDRGLPIDRHYIEVFLAAFAGDIRGRVLEVADDTYTRRFGGDLVTRHDVLHVSPGAPGVTVVGDLITGEGVPDAAFDCAIITQTLNVLPEPLLALRTLRRALRPGGVLLATAPGIAQLSRHDVDRWGEYWRFTSQGLERLGREAFGDGAVEVRAYGNVLAAVSLLHGLAVEDLTPAELDHRDRDYEVLLGLRATRP